MVSHRRLRATSFGLRATRYERAVKREPRTSSETGRGCSWLVAKMGATPVRDPRLVQCDPTLRGRVQRAAWRRLDLCIGKFCRLLKYVDEHFARELAGLRVLVRRMV
jgi:hypothetical protein